MMSPTFTKFAALPLPAIRRTDLVFDLLLQVPLLLLEQRVPYLILASLKSHKMPPETMPKWEWLAKRAESASQASARGYPSACVFISDVDESLAEPARKCPDPQEVRIGIVGKYTGLTDSYLSVTHGLVHAAIEIDRKLKVVWIDSTELESETKVRFQPESARASQLTSVCAATVQNSNPEAYEKAWKELASVQGVISLL